jgi:hypothetical protein
MFEKTNKRFCCDFVIPAKAGIQRKRSGFRGKPGMTKNHPQSKTVKFIIQRAIKTSF